MIGSAIIVVGLYSVLWGKYKEDQEEKQKLLLIQEIPDVVKDNNHNNGQFNNGGNHEEKVVMGPAAVAIDLPIFLPPIKPTQQV